VLSKIAGTLCKRFDDVTALAGVRCKSFDDATALAGALCKSFDDVTALAGALCKSFDDATALAAALSKIAETLSKWRGDLPLPGDTVGSHGELPDELRGDVASTPEPALGKCGIPKEIPRPRRETGGVGVEVEVEVGVGVEVEVEVGVEVAVAGLPSPSPSREQPSSLYPAPTVPSQSHSRIRHLPALDGLRGVALLGVLLFHAGGALPGGYLGVDLFFVLSGYLITSLLLAEHRETGTVALAAFWGRRARRLFPALLSLMPAIALYGRCVANPAELASLRADALATLAYVANWRTILSHKSYWDLFVAPSPLEHTWSLSIEEQFYVVWPPVVVFLLHRARPRAVFWAALTLVVASATAMLVLFDPRNTSRVYLGTDTRAAGILAGAVLATLMPQALTPGPRARRGLDALGVVAGVGLAAAWWRLEGDNPFLYKGGLWLTEAAALVLIVCATVGRESVVARALSWRPLTALGTVSYGVYLWHWPIDVWLTPERAHLRGLGLHALHFGLTLAIATLSYWLLEKPIRSRGLPFGRPAYVVPLAVAASVLLVVRATHARPVPPAAPLPAGATIAPGAAEGDPALFRVMLVGDSTANSLGWGLRGVRRAGVGVTLAGQDGCTMLADTCGGPDWTEQTGRVRPDATLVVLGGAFMHGIDVKGEWQRACGEEWDRRFEATLERRFADLRSRHGQVWAVTTPYALGAWDGRAVHAQVDCINRAIRSAVQAVPEVRLLDLAERLCPAGACAVEYGGETIRPDGVHYSVDGARGLAGWVLDELER